MFAFVLKGAIIYVILLGIFSAMSLRRVDLPKHLLHHPVIYTENLLEPNTADELLQLMKTMKNFPSNVGDTKFYNTAHEHIGEAIPIGSDGKCDHPFLVPSQKRTHCILPGRIDIGRHYIRSGGVDGLKEMYDDLVTRVQSFGRYMFNLTEYPLAENLFSSSKFQKFAKSVCPADQPILDPFQFNFIVQLPGQTVAVHTDAPYFWGASRFQFPQWLLATMVFSGLFQEKFVNQVQVVAYVHRWTDEKRVRGGEFIYWDSNNGTYGTVLPLPLSGSVVDGSKTVHAAIVYQKEVKPPRLDKSNENALVFVGDDEWELTSNGKTVQKYKTNDLRMSIVYRARCFASKEDKDRYPTTKQMSLEGILNTFKQDLIKKGKYSASYETNKLDFAMALMDEYIKYPLSTEVALPINYCAAAKTFPAIEPLLSMICN